MATITIAATSPATGYFVGRITLARRRMDGQEECPSYGAHRDLDEAWEIASRGPMPLFMADIHLHRARMFGLSESPELVAGLAGTLEQSELAVIAVGSQYPWQSVEHDLREARRLSKNMATAVASKNSKTPNTR